MFASCAACWAYHAVVTTHGDSDRRVHIGAMMNSSRPSSVNCIKAFGAVMVPRDYTVNWCNAAMRARGGG